MRQKVCECPNCGTEIEDLGTLTLICWECGITFMPKGDADYDGNDDYYRYD